MLCLVALPVGCLLVVMVSVGAAVLALSSCFRARPYTGPCSNSSLVDTDSSVGAVSLVCCMCVSLAAAVLAASCAVSVTCRAMYMCAAPHHFGTAAKPSWPPSPHHSLHVLSTVNTDESMTAQPAQHRQLSLPSSQHAHLIIQRLAHYCSNCKRRIEAWTQPKALLQQGTHRLQNTKHNAVQSDCLRRLRPSLAVPTSGH